MNKIQELKIMTMIGKWYRKQSLDFTYEYIYIKGITEHFETKSIMGHSIEINKSRGDSHRYSEIHVDRYFNSSHIKNMKLVVDKKLITEIDNLLGTLFYQLK